MYIVQSYPLAILFCFITMLCWGSWGNTQKLAGKTWRYELFYWDYVIGILLFSLVWALTVGSCGTEGRKFLPDLAQASWGNIGSAFVGGVVFNAANILLSAAIAVAGMAVAFPVGIGLALVLGVLINYIGSAKGDPVLLFGGVALVIVAIVLNGIAYKMISRGNRSAASSRGIVLALLAGLLMSFFYRFVAASMDLDNFVTPAAGKMTPYSAMVVFAVGIFLSTFIFNSIAIKRPVSGTPVSISAYFKGGIPDPSGRGAGRSDLGIGQRTQPDCSRQSGCRHLLRSGAGCYVGGGAMGRFCLERVPWRRPQSGLAPGMDVRALCRRHRVDYRCRQLTRTTDAKIITATKSKRIAYND